jgi:hypothetical protein
LTGKEGKTIFQKMIFVGFSLSLFIQVPVRGKNSGQLQLKTCTFLSIGPNTRPNMTRTTAIAHGTEFANGSKANGKVYGLFNVRKSKRSGIGFLAYL